MFHGVQEKKPLFVWLLAFGIPALSVLVGMAFRGRVAPAPGLVRPASSVRGVAKGWSRSRKAERRGPPTSPAPTGTG
jgi:hypothetical protein